MPATQRGQLDRLPSGRWRLRWYDNEGTRQSESFPSKSAGARHFREVIEPQLRGEPVPMPELTLSEFVPLFLERHAAGARPRTIENLGWRLGVATEAFGNVPLRDLERMSDEIAS